MLRFRYLKAFFESFSFKRLSAILALFTFVIGILIYFNTVKIALEEREEKYARLYAESISFFIEKGLESSCDYTFVQEVLSANETVPTIVVTDDSPMNYLNIQELDAKVAISAKEKEALLYKKIKEMSREHKPIPFNIGESKGYVYFSNSIIVKQLNYFPYILISTLLVFGGLAFVAYASSRRAEQNQVWVGLAKETAHQLGTPISGLMGWVEVLKINPDFDPEVGNEMLKDIERLEVITNRFSNIGSIPNKKSEEIGLLVSHAIEYLKKRISTKIQWTFDNQLAEPVYKSVNKNLLEWVIENLSKNAVDAMEGVGSLSVKIHSIAENKIAIDIKDTGKGISKSQIRKIFQPGFSTKKRGWGLGLTLAKRIIETYHDGHISILETVVGQGTTFRIIL